MATTLMPVRGEELPKPRTFEELPILVVDASGSMERQDLGKRLNQSRRCYTAPSQRPEQSF